MNIITIIATIFAALLVLGGLLQAVSNIKDFEEVASGSGMIFFGILIFLLCYG